MKTLFVIMPDIFSFIIVHICTDNMRAKMDQTVDCLAPLRAAGPRILVGMIFLTIKHCSERRVPLPLMGDHEEL